MPHDGVQPLKDLNGAVRFFPKIFFYLVAIFGHCAGQNVGGLMAFKKV